MARCSPGGRCTFRRDSHAPVAQGCRMPGVSNTPVASVDRQNAVAIASLAIASTTQPSVAPTARRTGTWCCRRGRPPPTRARRLPVEGHAPAELLRQKIGSERRGEHCTLVDRLRRIGGDELRRLVGSSARRLVGSSSASILYVACGTQDRRRGAQRRSARPSQRPSALGMKVFARSLTTAIWSSCHSGIRSASSRMRSSSAA